MGHKVVKVTIYDQDTGEEYVLDTPVRPSANKGGDLTLHSFGQKKICVIKAFREITGADLKEAKEFVETAEANAVGLVVPTNSVNSAKIHLETAGAEVELRGGRMVPSLGSEMILAFLQKAGVLA